MQQVGHMLKPRKTAGDQNYTPPLEREREEGRGASEQ